MDIENEIENCITLFSFESVKVRTVIREDDTDHPWFVAKDVCDVLGLKNVTAKLRNLPADEQNTLTTSKGIIHDGAGNPNVNIVSEPGLYRLVFQSRKPEAEKFKRWVFHEVLPEIRRTGMYGGQLLAKQVDVMVQFAADRVKADLRELPQWDSRVKLRKDIDYLVKESSGLRRTMARMINIHNEREKEFLKDQKEAKKREGELRQELQKLRSGAAPKVQCKRKGAGQKTDDPWEQDRLSRQADDPWKKRRYRAPKNPDDPWESPKPSQKTDDPWDQAMSLQEPDDPWERDRLSRKAMPSQETDDPWEKHQPSQEPDGLWE